MRYQQQPDDSYGNSTVTFTFFIQNFTKKLTCPRYWLLSLAAAFLWFLLCDFYLRGSVKGNVYKTYPHTLEYLRNSICREISGQEVQKINNVFRRCTNCIGSGGQHFQYLLQHWWFAVRLLKFYYHRGYFSPFPSPSVELPQNRRYDAKLDDRLTAA
jgi:hypothetical protein